MLDIIGRNHCVPVLAPSADMFNADPASRPIRRTAAGEIAWLIHLISGSTGTGKIQVEVCDDEDGTNPVAVDFRYRKALDGDDVPGAVTAAVAATGFTTTAGVEGLYQVVIDNREIHSDKEFIRIQTTEVVNSPVIGSITAILSKLKNEQQTPDTVLE